MIGNSLSNPQAVEIGDNQLKQEPLRTYLRLAA
jgi:hypothetical protein